MAHQRYTYGFTGEDETSHREDRFSPQNEADYERLARIAAAEAAGTDLLLDVRDIELYAHVSRKTVYRLVSRGVLREKRIGRNIRISKRVLAHVHLSDASPLDQPVTTDYVRPASAAQTHPAGDIETALRRLVESTAR